MVKGSRLEQLYAERKETRAYGATVLRDLAKHLLSLIRADKDESEWGRGIRAARDDMRQECERRAREIEGS